MERARARKRIAAYASAKTALLVLARSWALAEGSHGVRVNMISPGFIPHPHADSSTFRSQAIPLGRPGTAEEVAEAANWLTSEDASYVTGVNLEVAGGWGL